MSDNIPNPTDPVPIYGGRVEPIELYINGVKQPTPTKVIPVRYGELDVNTGIVTYYGKPYNDKQ